MGRFGDYLSAQFSASTDFRVGEAVKYLLNSDYKVGVKYRETQNPEEDEKELLRQLRQQYSMLNDLPGYNYKSSDEKKERIRIHEFMTGVVKGVLENSVGVEENAEPAPDTRDKENVALGQVKKRLGEQYIEDPAQKEIFLNQAKQFKQWANYIAGLVLTRNGKKEFTPQDVREILRKRLIPEHYGGPGAKEGSVLTQDMKLEAEYHGGLPCLQRTGRGRYKFIGFQTKE